MSSRAFRQRGFSLPSVFLVVFSLAVSLGFSQENAKRRERGAKTLGPRGVVDKFCRLDFTGARLSSASFAEVQPLIVWFDESGWEPGWATGSDTATIVSGYTVLSADQKEDKATVRVSFDVVGRMGPSGLVVEEKSETVDFRLVRLGGVWKIQGPAIEPHPSVRTMIEHIGELLERARSAGDFARVNELEGLLRRLKQRSEKRSSDEL